MVDCLREALGIADQLGMFEVAVAIDTALARSGPGGAVTAKLFIRPSRNVEPTARGNDDHGNPAQFEDVVQPEPQIGSADERVHVVEGSRSHNDERDEDKKPDQGETSPLIQPSRKERQKNGRQRRSSTHRDDEDLLQAPSLIIPTLSPG